MLKELENYQFNNFCDGVENLEQRFQAERVRLLAFYYRVEQDFEKAEKYMLQYRKIMPTDITETLSPEIRAKANSAYFSPDITLENWGQILSDLVDVQDQILEIAGLHEDTCGYFNCSDCCNYTSPHMSLTEYLYLKEWAEKNDYPISKAREKAKKFR